MTVSEFIFDFLQQKGCDCVYMVSGSSAMWLTDALKRNNGLKAVCCHHEQSAAMAADCYGRIHNTVPGVCLVTIGPGATNAITGVAEAYVDSSPMLILSGQASSALLQYEMKTGIRQHGTQSINLEPIVKPITKFFASVMEAKQIRYIMEKAYYEAVNGRKGPVWIDVPVDIQNKQIPSLEEMNGFTPEVGNNHVYDCQIDEVVGKLLASKKPLILAGYGVRSAGAVELLQQFIHQYQIPVVTSRGGIDLINSSSPLFVGRPGSYGDRASHFAIQQSDFLLVLGSRLSVSTIGYYPADFGKNAYKVMVDIDQKELDKSDVPIDIKMNMDIREFLYKAMNGKEREAADTVEWRKHCIDMRNLYQNVKQEYESEEPINSYYFTKQLSLWAKENTTVVVDTGSVCNIVSQSWQQKEKQRYLISGGLSCMGFWVGAMGAVSSQGDILALTGDGSMQMNIQELATLQYNQFPIKVFVYQNNGYLLIRHNQHNYMNDRFLGVGPDSGLKTPDFVRVAEAYGVKAVRIKEGKEIENKIKEVLEYRGPVVCEVMLQEFGKIEPRIASKVMEDGSLKAAEFDDLYPFL